MRKQKDVVWDGVPRGHLPAHPDLRMTCPACESKVTHFVLVKPGRLDVEVRCPSCGRSHRRRK